MGKAVQRFGIVAIVVLIAAALVGSVPLQPRIASAQTGLPVGSTVQTTTATNVRSGPCTTYPVIYSVPTATRFTVLDTGQTCGEYTFIRVRRVSDSTTGYLAAELVSLVATPVPSSTPTRTTTPPTRTATRTQTPLGGWSAGDLAQTTAAVNFRSGPGTNFSIISTLPSGSSLLVTGGAQSGQGGVFVPVRSGSTNGWVSADWITKTGRATATATRTPTRTSTATRTATVTNTATITTTPTVTNTRTATATPTETLTPSETSTPTQTLTPSKTSTASRTATITQTPPNGFGPGDIVEVQQSLNLRATPGGTVIDVLPTGATLLVTGTGLTKDGIFWIPVRYNSLNGWVASQYVDKIGVATATATRTPSVTRTVTLTPTITKTPSSTNTATATRTQTATLTPVGGFAAGDLVRVDQSVYLRPSAGTGGTPIATLPTGAILLVTGTGQSANGYFFIPVSYNSLTGWVASNYVSKIGVATATATATATSTITSTPTITVTRTATLTGTPTPIGGFGNGDVVRTNVTVNIRAYPNLTATIIATVPSGTTLTVTGLGGEADGHFWIPVTNGTASGWIASDYVTNLGAATATATITSTPNLSVTATSTATATVTPSLTPTPTSGPGGFKPGDIAHTTTGVNMRSAPGTSASIVELLDQGTQVEITGYGQSANGYFWVPVVTEDDVAGWIADTYLDPGVAPALEPTETPVPTETVAVDEPTIEIPPTEEPTFEVPPTEEPTLEPTLELPTETPLTEPSEGTPAS